MTQHHGSSARPANALGHERSPYLRQHAHNPVEWMPWGPAAFTEARRRDVPIFLSVGYSTCYWCHVMERESFEDEATARLMNERFVNVKVDREERPDVDAIYMAAVQLTTGHGGWPMSVAIEPQGLRPFWGGTYFPPRPAHGLPSFSQVLEGLFRAWKDDRAGVLAAAERLTGAVGEHLAARRSPVSVGAEQVSQAVMTLLTIHDRTHGGFGNAPKFPQPSYAEFLLAVRTAADESTRQAADAAVRSTLDAMALGGIFDQVGGGFHRYSVDAYWLVPHFEKMLYDNGLLLGTYARASAVFGDELYRRTARRIAAYLSREMTASDGALFTAQDAEVDGREGLNYLWDPASMRAALGADAEWAMNVYGIADGPNFRDPHHPEAPAANVLRLARRPEELATAAGLPLDSFLERLDAVNARLLNARSLRKPPRLDDKVLASWNGLAISGLAVAGRLLHEPGLVSQASAAARAVLKRLWDGRSLGRCEREGASVVPGSLEDYAMLAQGLLELHRADPAGQWLGTAGELLEAAEARLGDGSGGYFDAPPEASELFVRPRSTYDGAMPSGAGAMLHALIDMGELTGDGKWLDRARGCLVSVSAAIAESPIATVNSTLALLRLLTADRGAVRRSFSAAGAAAPSASGTSNAEIGVYASVSEVYVEPGSPEEFTLRLEIPEGLHLTAADDDAGGALTPLGVSVAGGTGFAAFADYPPGEPLSDADRHRVLRGVVEFPVAVESEGEISGRPGLVLSYQACTDRACHEPVYLRLDVALHRGRRPPQAAGLA